MDDRELGIRGWLAHFALSQTKGNHLPDDMADFIILMWHRNLNSQPLKMEEEIAAIQKRMVEDQKKRDEDKKTTVIEKKPHKE
jgi:hypothetical protein